MSGQPSYPLPTCPGALKMTKFKNRVQKRSHVASKVRAARSRPMPSSDKSASGSACSYSHRSRAGLAGSGIAGTSMTTFFATWNVRTMCPGYETDPRETNDLRKTAVIDCELKHLGVGIAALQETRLSGTGSLREKNYTFFWKGKAADESRLHGVGCAVHNSLLSSVEPPPQGAQSAFCSCALTQFPALSLPLACIHQLWVRQKTKKTSSIANSMRWLVVYPSRITFFSLATSMPELALTTSPGPPVSAGMAWTI